MKYSNTKNPKNLFRHLTNVLLWAMLVGAGLFLNACGSGDSDPGVPVITSFSPESGLAGSEVTINGTNLDQVISILFNGVKATPTLKTATQIKVPVPAGASSGKIKLTFGSGNVESSSDFTVTFKQVAVSDFEEEDVATIWGLSEDAGDISKSEFLTADGNTYFHLKGADTNNNYWVGGRYHGTGNPATPLGVVENDPAKVFLNFKIKNNNLVDGNPSQFKPVFYVYDADQENDKMNWEIDFPVTWSEWKVVSIAAKDFHRWNGSGFSPFSGNINTVSEVALYITGYGADFVPASGSCDFSIDDIVFSEGAALGQIITP